MESPDDDATLKIADFGLAKECQGNNQPDDWLRQSWLPGSSDHPPQTLRFADSLYHMCIHIFDSHCICVPCCRQAGGHVGHRSSGVRAAGWLPPLPRRRHQGGSPKGPGRDQELWQPQSPDLVISRVAGSSASGPAGSRKPCPCAAPALVQMASKKTVEEPFETAFVVSSVCYFFVC